MNLPKPENLAEVVELQRVEQEKAKLEQSLADDVFPVPEIAAAYETALEKLGETAITLANSPEAQSAYAALGSEAQIGLRQLEPLTGILPQEEIEQLQASLNARILSAREFFDKYGVHATAAEQFIQSLTPQELALADTTEITPVPDDTDQTEGLNDETPPAARVRGFRRSGSGSAIKHREVSHEISTKPTEVLITVGLNVVRIGKEGKSVRYSQKSGGRFRDYTEPRRRAILKIASLEEGESIKARELFAVAFGNEEFHTNKMLELRSWLDRLTFRREKMISYTRRGLYFVNPKFKLEPKLGSKLEAATSQDQDTGQTLEEKPAPEELNLQGAMWIMADKLREFSFVLEEKGAGAITDEMLAAMDAYRPDMSALRGDSDAIRNYRLKAMRQLMDLVNDKDRFFEFYDSMDQSSAAYGFVEFLGTLGEEDSILVERLLTARIVTAKPSRGQVISVPRQVFDDENGLIYPFPAISPTPVAAAQSVVIPEIDANETPVAGLGDWGFPPEGALPLEGQVEDVMIGPDEIPNAAAEELQSQDISSKKWNEKELSQFKDLKSAALDYATRFISRFPPESKQQLPMLASVFPKFNANNAASAWDSGILRKLKKSQGHKTYSIEETVTVLLYSDKSLQNLIKTRKYKAEVARLIKESIEEAIKIAQTQAAS